MKSNILVKVLQLQITLVILAVFCVSSQAFKLPINLKRSMKEIPHQDETTQLQVDGEENLGPVKVLFPEKTDDNEDKEYQIQLSFKSQDEIPEEQTKNGDNAGLERFYKYNVKAQPSVDQAIVFPKEADGNAQTQRIGENEENESNIATDASSDGNSVENIPLGIENEDSKKNSSNATSFRQSVDFLVQMVYQLLFHENVTGTSSPLVTTGTSSSESDVQVQEQSLYSGPKLRNSQSSNSECPDGTKKNRNGSCQKPSRRFTS